MLVLLDFLVSLKIQAAGCHDYAELPVTQAGNKAGHFTHTDRVCCRVTFGFQREVNEDRACSVKHIVLADLNEDNAASAAKTLSDAGFAVSTAKVDVSSRDSVQKLVEATKDFGDVSGVIHAAGVSPLQASPETILKVDLYGTALVLEEFGNIIARGGSGVVIASQSGHRLPPLSQEENMALATTPVEELLKLPMLQPDQVHDSLHAYQLSKRGNSLRVMVEAVRWGNPGARVNTISPGIIITPWQMMNSKGRAVRDIAE